MAKGQRERIAIIMAGGSGERFWPLSRRLRPKQLLNLTNTNESILSEAISRVTPIIPAENIYVATGEHLIEPVRAANVGVPDQNVLAEPCKRNTAGCLAYATAHILADRAQPGESPDSQELQRRYTLAILTADHIIGDADKFRETVDVIMSAAERENALGVIGVVPTRPETGYGYVEIEEGELLEKYAKGVRVYPVSAFHEKPTQERARAFLHSGGYFWNAGMFFWNLDVFMTELALAKPEFAEAAIEMARALQKGDDAHVRRIFEGLEDISIDYALMEKAHNVIVARAEFPWDDIGSWPALERTFPRDGAGNIVVGDPVAVNCKGCIVYRDETAAKKDIAVAVVGATDLVVVVTEDAILVTPKDKAQDVKLAVSELASRGAKHI